VCYSHERDDHLRKAYVKNKVSCKPCRVQKTNEGEKRQLKANKKTQVLPRLLVFLCCSARLSPSRNYAWFENEGKGNKEGIAFIILARSHVFFDNSATEVKKLKSQEKQDDAAWLPLNRHSRFLGASSRSRHVLASACARVAFSNLSFSRSWRMFLSDILGVLNSFELNSRTGEEKFCHPISEDGFVHGQ
jgi:hypothetical protein